MQRVRHFWRKVPEIGGGGWKWCNGYSASRRGDLLSCTQDPVPATVEAAPYGDAELTDLGLPAAKEARSEPGIPE